MIKRSYFFQAELQDLDQSKFHYGIVSKRSLLPNPSAALALVAESSCRLWNCPDSQVKVVSFNSVSIGVNIPKYKVVSERAHFLNLNVERHYIYRRVFLIFWEYTDIFCSSRDEAEKRVAKMNSD